VPNNDQCKEKTIWTDTVTGNYVPLLHQTSFTGPQFTQHTQMPNGGYHARCEGSPFLDQTKRVESRLDDAARRFRVDVPDYHGNFEPHTFQDQITSLED
jgi:hypothetical protein